MSVQGYVLAPDGAPSDLGIVVLGGSSGRVDVDRAGLFTKHGATALAMRWFGGEGQSPGICEIPLESFVEATNLLVERGCKRIAFLGTSKGAEAALLAAALDKRIDVVIGLSPTSVAWGQSGPGVDGQEWPVRSSWTLQGDPLPFVSYDVPWFLQQPQTKPVAYRPYHARSLQTFAADIEAATIPVEETKAQIILVAGEDDMLWPSAVFAGELAARRKDAILVTHPRAGHRIVFPGEPMQPRPEARAWGGTDEADAELGAMAWAEIARVLKF